MRLTQPRLTDDSVLRQRLVLVTGPSGAGRSTAINTLEDAGYEAIDNLPISLLPRLLENGVSDRPLALGIDARNRDFSTKGLLELLDNYSLSGDQAIEVLYLDCSTEVLLRRFSETRRRHPLAPSETPEIGIQREQDLLVPIRACADILIDTSDMSPHELRAEVEQWYAAEKSQKLAVSVHSFSYKQGMPRGIDMVFDCRFLQNPYWQEDLRALNGLDKAVADYVAQDKRYDDFFSKVCDFSEMLLPAYIEEGKAHFSIGFGCTGGQHRSVAVAENVSNVLAKAGWQVSTRHREIERRTRTSSGTKLGKTA
ncbi:RNase adapter RapZ [Falsihalocynthiibacter arcticus]|uniref:RNase adapter RapZ n=1 Tax=Falsihalocynthiibacter arcticus TaxID=1579316 RepID=UPI0030021C7E